MDYCLGVEFLGKCSDYTNYQLSVFNIGVFVAVIGVFFAGYQLIESEHKIRFKIRYNNFTLCLLLIPAITSIIGTLLPYMPGRPLPFLGYTIFWEIFTSLYIIIIGGFLIKYLFFNKVSKFDIKIGKINYLYNNYLAKNQYIEALVFELSYFFEDFLNEYRGEIEKNEWSSAHQFMKILQNQRLIDSIIGNPVTIQKILNCYYSDDRRDFSYDEEKFLQKIILGSFMKENSYLVLELNGNFNVYYDSRNGIVLKNIIEDLNFLRKLKILGSSNTYNYSNNPIFANNCLKFTSKIINEFLNKERIDKNYSQYRLLYDVFETQANIIEQSFEKISPLLKSELLGDNYGLNLSKISPELLKLYGGVKFPDIFLNKKNHIGYHKSYSNKNLIDAFAFGIFRLIQSFSRFKNEDIRQYTLDYTHLCFDSHLSKEIEKRILILFFQEIIKNITGGYAMVSRVFWENYSWDIINNSENIEKNKQIINILKLYAKGIPKLLDGYIYSYTTETLQDSYRKGKAIEKADEILGNLFPKYISYNQNNHSLMIYGMDNLYYSELDLNALLKSGKITFMKKEQK